MDVGGDDCEEEEEAVEDDILVEACQEHDGEGWEDDVEHADYETFEHLGLVELPTWTVDGSVAWQGSLSGLMVFNDLCSSRRVSRCVSSGVSGWSALEALLESSTSRIT